MRHLYGIDCVRFFAAGLVVLFHFSRFGLTPGDFDPAPGASAFGWLQPLGWCGWVGVQIFFVISGYVIAASAQKATTRSFVIKRGIRVFPALWICSAIALTVRLAWGDPAGPTLAAFGRSVVLSPKGPYLDGVVWTLVLEAVFYALIAAIILRHAPGGSRMALFERGALALGGISTVFLIFFVFASHVGLEFQGHALADVLGGFEFKLLLLWHGVFFALGILLWLIDREGPTPLRYRAAAVFAVMGVVEISIDAGGGLRAIAPTLLWVAAVGIVILSTRLETPMPAWSQKSVRTMGLMTYPLYLNHYTFGMYLIGFLAPVVDSRAVLLVLCLTIVFGSSWAIVQWPERALQRGAKRALKPDRPSAAQAAYSAAS